MDCHKYKLIRFKEFKTQLQGLSLFEQPKYQSYLSSTGFPSSIALTRTFYWWLLKLFTAWRQIIFANWSAEGIQLDIPSDPAKKLCLRLEVPSGKMLPTLGFRAFCYAAPKLWNKLQILNAMWKHIFLNKLLICSSVFVSFILLFITYIFLLVRKFYSFLVFF